MQTIPIEEFNKTRQALEEVNNKIHTLTKKNEDMINKNEISLAEIEYVEFQIRIDKIANILSRLNLSEQERSKLQQTLVNSDLAIEFIEETYAPISKKNIFETKLPQKSIADRSNELSYYK